MYLISILLQPAVLWIVLYYVVGEHEVPDFRPLIVVFLLIAIASAFISYRLGIFQPIVSSVVFVLVLTFLYHINLLKAVISVVVFFGVMIVVNLIQIALKS